MAKKTKKVAAKQAATKAKVPRELVHYYRLVFQVAPGGSRKAEFFVAGTLEEVKQAAQADLQSGEGAYHALFYGEQIVLQCWQGNEKVASIDLHPFITYRVEGLDAPITFPGEGDEPVLDMYDDANEKLMYAMAEERIDIQVTIDWASVSLPKLGGRPLSEHEMAPFDDAEFPWAYGFVSKWDSPIRDP